MNEKKKKMETTYGKEDEMLAALIVGMAERNAFEVCCGCGREEEFYEVVECCINYRRDKNY